ncbi:hypothetical protein GCM10011419_28510 [Vogesella fluminis]|uniref:Uncharacterized protein n=1 Tax=Vogesella fluminis TaxID=1069161 RepID=A0ABQ3HED6_9NEIS|nr:hypothetical protein GCM10011419_28510 [Vogesella fluminis]
MLAAGTVKVALPQVNELTLAARPLAANRQRGVNTEGRMHVVAPKCEWPHTPKGTRPCG